MIRLCAAVCLVAFVGACASPVAEPTPTAISVAGFEFIRDDIGLLPAIDRSRTEGQLRDIASRTGVFGVVVTGAHQPADPPRVYSPIMDEIHARGGQGLIAVCTPDSCAFDAPGAVSDGLADAVGLVAAAPERPRENPRAVPLGDQAFELHRWVEYVGAIASIAAEGD